MITRHGSPVVLAGALLAIVGGGLAYMMTDSLLISLGSSAACMIVCTIIANRAKPVSEAVASENPSRFPTIARSALFYLTIGALAEVWGGVWHAYMSNGHPPEHDVAWFACYGLLGSGLVFLLIGLLVGQIGRSARESELPPAAVMPATGQK